MKLENSIYYHQHLIFHITLSFKSKRVPFSKPDESDVHLFNILLKHPYSGDGLLELVLRLYQVSVKFLLERLAHLCLLQLLKQLGQLTLLLGQHLLKVRYLLGRVLLQG